MTNTSAPLTPTDLIAAAVSVLEAGGYRSVQNGFPDWTTTSTRLFEDKYNVVGIAVFVTFAELCRSWTDLQGSLVDVISQHVGRSEQKAWDGYLVLLTPGVAPSGGLSLEEIRHDTTRLRKLVATGEDLSGAGDVERLLRSLLPLRAEQGEIREPSALDLLPDLLAPHEIDPEVTRTLVKAFLEQKPLMDAIHRHRGGQ
jgi:hypothetical protein